MTPADVAAAAATPETSILSMFWSAHIVVKAVMLGLFLASLWCWTIIFDKTRLFHKFKNEMENFEQVFWSGQSLEELYTSLSSQPNAGAAALFVAAMREWKRSFQQAAGSFRGLHARIDKVLDVSIAREVERLESNLLVLATVASAGPFIGLFGTVFGIMNSFQSIAASKNTSLAVVAPGHRGSAARHRDRPLRRDPGAHRLQQVPGRRGQGAGAAGKLRRRVLLHPLAADRPSSVGREGVLRRREPEHGAYRSAAGRKSGRGRRGVPRYGAMADINMTPFIDVMLVLLIIFMVAAPLLTTGVSVDLPQTSAGALNVERKPIAVSLNEQGQLYLMDQPIADADLVPKLQAASQNDVEQRIYLRASKVGSVRKGGADHGGHDRGRIQEGGAGHRADQSIAGSGFGRAAVILGLGGSRARCMGRCWFSSSSASPRAPRFEDNPESIPVETVSLSELNQIMNGEKDAQPAPEPPPRPEPAAPPKPPEPPPDLRAAEEPPAAAAQAGTAAAETRAAASAAKAHAASRRRSRSPGSAGAARAPEGTAAGEAEAGPDRKSGRARENREPKPARVYDPNAIAKLIGQPKPRTAATVRRRRRTRRRRGFRTMTRRACRCRWPRRSTPG